MSYFLFFVLGVILGLLLNPIKTVVQSKLSEIKTLPRGKTKFFEATTFKEKYKDAKEIGDIL